MGIYRNSKVFPIDTGSNHTKKTASADLWAFGMSMMDSLELGYVLLDESYRVLEMNSYAKNTIDNSDQIKLNSGGRLYVNMPVVDESSSWPSTDSPTKLPESGQYEPLTLDSVQKNHVVTESLIIDVFDFPSEHQVAPAVHYALIQNHQIRSHEFFENLASEYSLTKTELSILIATVQGMSNKRIASTRCVAYETIRSQVRAIYEKTNSFSRGDLFSLVWFKWLTDGFWIRQRVNHD